MNSRTKEAENVSLKLSILTKRTEIEVIASKLKVYILASKGDKSIKISAYQCDVGVKFEQVATRKIMVHVKITKLRCKFSWQLPREVIYQLCNTSKIVYLDSKI